MLGQVSSRLSTATKLQNWLHFRHHLSCSAPSSLLRSPLSSQQFESRGQRSRPSSPAVVNNRDSSLFSKSLEMNAPSVGPFLNRGLKTWEQERKEWRGREQSSARPPADFADVYTARGSFVLRNSLERALLSKRGFPSEEFKVPLSLVVDVMTDLHEQDCL